MAEGVNRLTPVSSKHRRGALRRADGCWLPSPHLLQHTAFRSYRDCVRGAPQPQKESGLQNHHMIVTVRKTD